MSEEDIDLGELQEATLAALSAVRDEQVALFDAASNDETAMGTIRRLTAYQAARGTAVLYLAQSGMPWDAEIVLRSFYETSGRILLLCVAGREERAQLDREYWEVLRPIGERRRALKVEKARGDHRFSDPRAGAVLDVLADPSLFDVAPTGSKVERKAIEQKWSFQEIIDALSRTTESGPRGLNHLKGCLHSYGLASHLLHADGAALDLMHDRAARPPRESALLAASQIARMFTDLVGLRFVCTEALRLMLELEFADAKGLQRAVWRCFELSDPVSSAFYDTQTDLYRRYGRSEFDPPSSTSSDGG